MLEAQFVPYDDEKHRTQFYELNLEYLTWVDKEIYTRYGANVNPNGTVKEYLDTVFQGFTEIKPPEGLICILEVDGYAVGMGALKRLLDNIGEIKRMYIHPDYRGKGFGNEVYLMLENHAKGFGYRKLRLDTAKFLTAAYHIYSKKGFKEVNRYSGGEWDHRDDIDEWTIYMEKELK